jgi:hypothetical protein
MVMEPPLIEVESLEGILGPVSVDSSVVVAEHGGMPCGSMAMDEEGSSDERCKESEEHYFHFTTLPKRKKECGLKECGS